MLFSTILLHALLLIIPLCCFCFFSTIVAPFSEHSIQWNIINNRAIQSIINTHYSIFPDTTMSKHQVFISNPGNCYYFEDNSCLILTIHLFRFNTNDNDYQLSCFNSHTLIDFGTFHIIRIEPKWNNRQKSFSFLSLHSLRTDSKYLITVLYRHAKEIRIYNDNCAKWLILLSFVLISWSLCDTC